ncbi:Galactocerebrosidase [Geodia barretti]|uniref:Galactocerebrosidase n=1 Tax=Geodia barretti TaxID=519541 RepID=A0AA35SUJ8_GEOBA|nr:Galactocerebrosidase [Geodia barretti]
MTVWCNAAQQPVDLGMKLISGVFVLVGTRTDVFAEVSVLLEGEGTAVFLAARMSQGGCGVAKATGVFLWLDSTGFYNITTDLAGKEQVVSEKFAVSLQTWYSLVITTQGDSVFVAIQGGGSVTSNKVTVKAQSGYVAMGTGGFYSAQFDNFAILTAS